MPANLNADENFTVLAAADIPARVERRKLGCGAYNEIREGRMRNDLGEPCYTKISQQELD
jgi:hypothetical protein